MVMLNKQLMHGEIFINDLGWVGFDPSHDKCIDEGYVGSMLRS